jgi:hypothetical protein
MLKKGKASFAISVQLRHEKRERVSLMAKAARHLHVGGSKNFQGSVPDCFIEKTEKLSESCTNRRDLPVRNYARLELVHFWLEVGL